MNRDAMTAALKETLVPALRARGFKGSLPHFRRIGEERVDLLTVQFDRHGGGFIVEISRCGSTGVTTAWGQHIPATKGTAHDLHTDKRHRPGSPRPGIDGRQVRFDYRTPNPAVSKSLIDHLAEAGKWVMSCHA